MRSKALGIGATVRIILGATIIGFAPECMGAPEPDWVFTVQASATVQVTPPQITLAWEPDQFGAVSYTVYRKGKKDTSWGSPLATLSGSASSFTDSAVSVGATYEYQIVKVG